MKSVSALIDNPAPASLSARIDRQCERDASIASAFEALMTEFILALEQDPTREISTPGFNDAHMPLVEVVNDRLAAVGCEDMLLGLLHIVRACLANQPLSAHIMAKAWAAHASRQHAEYHAADLADELAEAT